LELNNNNLNTVPSRLGHSKRTKIERKQRRNMVAANLLSGLSYREMANALDVSIGTIANDVNALIKEWGRENIERISLHQHLQHARLNRLLNAVWKKATEGELASIDRAIRIEERRSRLLGLDAPSRFQINPSELTDEQIIRALKGESIGDILD